MKQLLFLIIASFFLIAATYKQVIVSPGLKGMNSNTDPMQLEPTEARYLYNMTATETPGAIRGRRGLLMVTDQDGASNLNGAYGYYHSRKGWKILFGIEQNLVASKNKYTLLVRSDTFGTWMTHNDADSIGDTNLAFIKMTGNSEFVDFVKYDDNLIFTDGNLTPLVFTAERIIVDTTDTTTAEFYTLDTGQYSPYVTSLGFEAPGQLRVSTVGIGVRAIPIGQDPTDYTKTGAYQYKYAYLIDGNSDGDFDDSDDSVTFASIPSKTIYLEDNDAYLTGFELQAKGFIGGVSSIKDSLNCVVIRRKDNGAWYVIDTILDPSLTLGDQIRYEDTKADGDTLYRWVDDTLGMFLQSNPMKIVEEAARPGAFVRDPLPHTIGLRAKISDGTICDTTETRWIAYSYYDPITNVESPMGPATKIDKQNDYATGTNDDTVATYRKGYSNDIERPSHIRAYRSAGDDSTDFIGMYEFRANLMMRGDSIKLNWIPVYVTDDSARIGEITGGATNWNYSVIGLELENVDTRFGTQPWKIKRKFSGRPANLLIDAFGGPINRPSLYPFRYGCPYVLSDLEFSVGRMWGIGDPEFPQRLYYSDFNDIANWQPNAFFSMDEDDDDELVAIVKMEGSFGPILYALKHNKIFIIIGYDPASDLTFYPVDTEIGAANHKSVIKVGKSVFFLSPDYKVYELIGDSKPLEISLPVADEFLSLFQYSSGWGQFRDNGTPMAYRITDHVVFANEDSTRALAYNYKNKSWSIFEYGNPDVSPTEYIKPRFSFNFDTTQGNRGFSKNSYYVVDDSNRLFLEHAFNYDKNDIGGAKILGFDRQYTSSCYGDGKYLWKLLSISLDIRINVFDTIYIDVLDKDGATIASTEYPIFSGSGSPSNIMEFGVPYHDGVSCVSFRISFGPNLISSETNVDVILYGVSGRHKRMGKDGIF